MAGPGDALFLALANAKAQPDRWARALGAGTEAANNILGGYVQGLGIKRKMQEYPLELAQKKANILEANAKLAEQYGPDAANQMMGPTNKEAGIDIPTFGNSGVSGSQYTNEQLVNMPGTFSKNLLGNREKGLTLSNNAPFSPEVANYIGNGDVAGLSKYHKGRGEEVPYREMQQAITAKTSNTRGGYYSAKEGQINLQQLPSEMGPNTGPGAAFMVKFAAHQGKSLIANPGAYQQLGMTQGDAARAILRQSPTDEAMKNSNFSDTFIGRYNKLKAAITADPTQIDQPLMRKGLYDILDEMDKSATPIIANHLANRESYGLSTPPAVRRRELGLDTPDVSFNPGGGSAQNPNISTGIPKGMIRIKDSQGGLHDIPQENFGKAKQRDPGVVALNQ